MIMTPFLLMELQDYGSGLFHCLKFVMLHICLLVLLGSQTMWRREVWTLLSRACWDINSPHKATSFAAASLTQSLAGPHCQVPSKRHWFCCIQKVGHLAYNLNNNQMVLYVPIERMQGSYTVSV
jgi:hypothetical protein